MPIRSFNSVKTNLGSLSFRNHIQDWLMEPNKAHHANHEIESRMSFLVITVDQVLKSKGPPGRDQNLHLGIEIIAKDIE